MKQWLEDGRTGPEDDLTPRELEVVKLIAEAHTNRQIAEALQLSEKTVESHRGNVLAKLGHARPRGAGALRDPARARGALAGRSRRSGLALRSAR